MLRFSIPEPTLYPVLAKLPRSPTTQPDPVAAQATAPNWPDVAECIPLTVEDITADRLACNITVEKQVYQLGEPIVVTLVAQNQQTTPILIHEAFEHEYGSVGIEISYQGEPGYYNSEPGYPIVDGISEPRPLNPGQSAYVQRKILYQHENSYRVDRSRYYAMEKPGRYFIRFFLSSIIPGAMIVSAPVEIQVAEPISVDKQVWRLLQSEETAYALHVGRMESPSVAAEFTAILTYFPDSQYAPAIRTLLDAAGPIQPDPAVTIMYVNGQAYLVRSAIKGVAEDVVSKITLWRLLRLTNAWTTAWNEQDFDGYASLYGSDSWLRKAWLEGAGSFSYNTHEKQMKERFMAIGRLSVVIRDFTIGEDKIIADVVGRFEPDTFRYSFEQLGFVREGWWRWRLTAPGFSL